MRVPSAESTRLIREFGFVQHSYPKPSPASYYSGEYRRAGDLVLYLRRAVCGFLVVCPTWLSQRSDHTVDRSHRAVPDRIRGDVCACVREHSARVPHAYDVREAQLSAGPVPGSH